MMGWEYGSGVGGWLVMVPMMLLLWGGLALVVGWALHLARRTGPERADDVLAERFARGEIDEAEFESRRAALGRAAGYRTS